ncbi:MAG: hypothetical protein ACKVRN_10430 [Pyrinomonadaceae bacterium]
MTPDDPGKRHRNFSFMLDYAGIATLGERISGVSLMRADGTQVKFRRLMAGEYLAEDDFEGFSYTIDLTPLKEPRAAAHISWLTDEGGILFFPDMLPLAKISSVEVKKGTDVITTYNRFDPLQLRNTLDLIYGPNRLKYGLVAYYGSDSRIKQVVSGSTDLTVRIGGKWKFSDETARKMSIEILSNYERFYGSSPLLPIDITVKPFPVKVSVGTYEADTRGNYVTIVSSDMPFESESVQRLHEILRHEIFHLWIPNGVNLSGNFDWFYEGFALYQSLKLGVAVNRIRFDDYLYTLSRAYDLDRAQTQKISLIDVSRNRWVGSNNTRVYARGMLVAFLCDLALLEKSKGKRSVADLLRQLYERHRPPNSETDGNTAVLALLRSHRELAPILDRNITGSESIEWNDLLKGAGLEAEQKGQMTKLKVTAKPSGRQKDLLDKLGYNNWRKLVSK